jgi:hypothetical protein
MPASNLELSKQDRTMFNGLKSARETTREEILRLRKEPVSVTQMQRLTHAEATYASLRDQINQLVYEDDHELTTFVSRAYPGINVLVRSNYDLGLTEFIFTGIRFGDISEFDAFRTANLARYASNPVMKQALQFYQAVENAGQIVQTTCVGADLSFTLDPLERDELIKTLAARIDELTPVQAVVESRADEIERLKQEHDMYTYNNTGIWFGNGTAPTTPPVSTPFLNPAMLEALNALDHSSQKQEHSGPRR